MFKYHASYVMMEITRLIAVRVRDDTISEATKLGKILTSLEDIFPESKQELDKRYGTYDMIKKSL